MASPLEIIIEASNGASDYGNKFGEPVISGFARTYGATNMDNANIRREWIKPIMFSGGLGTMDANFVNKASFLKSYSNTEYLTIIMHDTCVQVERIKLDRKKSPLPFFTQS